MCRLGPAGRTQRPTSNWRGLNKSDVDGNFPSGRRYQTQFMPPVALDFCEQKPTPLLEIPAFERRLRVHHDGRNNRENGQQCDRTGREKTTSGAFSEGVIASVRGRSARPTGRPVSTKVRLEIFVGRRISRKRSPIGRTIMLAVVTRVSMSRGFHGTTLSSEHGHAYCTHCRPAMQVVHGRGSGIPES